MSARRMTEAGKEQEHIKAEKKRGENGEEEHDER